MIYNRIKSLVYNFHSLCINTVRKDEIGFTATIKILYNESNNVSGNDIIYFIYYQLRWIDFLV